MNSNVNQLKALNRHPDESDLPLLRYIRLILEATELFDTFIQFRF